MMFVRSGECKLCEVGRETDLFTMGGSQLFTGDIVIIYTYDVENHILESIANGLTVVVDDSSPHCHDFGVLVNKDRYPFIMGIKGCNLKRIDDFFYMKADDSSAHWAVERVKSFQDVVHGEHWKEYGFNYHVFTNYPGVAR